MKVPSDDNLSAAYPPFPLVIVFLIFCNTFGKKLIPYLVDDIN